MNSLTFLLRDVYRAHDWEGVRDTPGFHRGGATHHREADEADRDHRPERVSPLCWPRSVHSAFLVLCHCVWPSRISCGALSIAFSDTKKLKYLAFDFVFIVSLKGRDIEWLLFHFMHFLHSFGCLGEIQDRYYYFLSCIFFFFAVYSVILSARKI